MEMAVMEQVAHEQGKGKLAFLAFTSLVCGATVMIVEVLGSRVIGPFFGASLYVWTSLITVTLVALAAGYWVGGTFSDKNRSESWLYVIIAMSGVAILLVPLVKGMAIRMALPMGLRAGSLVSAGILFGPSLFLLGTVSPLIIRTAAREMASIGRTVGLFSSISTVGSFIGTVCTGFVLIAYFPINRIFVVVGSALLVLAALYFLLFKRRATLLPLLLLPLVIPIGGGAKTTVTSDGTTLTRVYFRDTFYGNMQVHDYTYGNRHTREMIIDASIQGGIDMTNGQSVYEYSYFLGIIPRIINPHGKECLVVGLGPGAVPMWYEQQGVRTDVVDIDPAVFDVARRYFGFAVSGKTYVEDARYFLNRSGKRYDYIVMDVFNSDNTPFHVMSREALQSLKGRLTPEGVLGINMLGSVRGNTYMTASVVRTLKEVFQTVDIYPAFEGADFDGIGNLEIFAYDRKSVIPDRKQLDAFQVHPMAKGVRGMMTRRFEFPAGTPAIVLTDSYNPIDFYDIRTKEFIRKRIIDAIDFDFLLS